MVEEILIKAELFHGFRGIVFRIKIKKIG